MTEVLKKIKLNKTGLKVHTNTFVMWSPTMAAAVSP
jgi:hypothetical protein